MSTYAQWLEKLSELAEEYAGLAACEVSGTNWKRDSEDTENARLALLAHAKLAREVVVKEVVGLFQVEGSDFYYNDANKSGAITVSISTGATNPWEHLRGAEVQAEYYKGVRGTGRYWLNDAFVPVLMAKLEGVQEMEGPTE